MFGVGMSLGFDNNGKIQSFLVFIKINESFYIELCFNILLIDSRTYINDTL